MIELHIHINAAYIAPYLERYVTRLGFLRRDFSGHPVGKHEYEPKIHLSRKLYSSKEFKVLFEQVVQQAKSSGGLIGYIEGEFVARRNIIPEEKYDKRIPIPFKVTTRPQHRFRKSEIHLSLDSKQSHPLIIDSLYEMGMVSAFLPKGYHMMQVFTLQGTLDQMFLLYSLLFGYVKGAGGIVGGTIKEERTARSWQSSVDIELPPNVHAIELQDSTD